MRFTSSDVRFTWCHVLVHGVALNLKFPTLQSSSELNQAQTAMALAAQHMMVDNDPHKSSEDRGREVLPRNRVHRMMGRYAK